MPAPQISNVYARRLLVTVALALAVAATYLTIGTSAQQTSDKATKATPVAKVKGGGTPAVAKTTTTRRQDVNGPVSTDGLIGVPETVAQIMEREALSGQGLQEEKETEIHKIRPDRKNLPQNPESLDAAQWPLLDEQAAGQEVIPSLAPQTLGTSLTGATLSGVNPTSAFPPDSMGAVGPTQYVVAVNGRIVTFNKSTGVADGVINSTTNTFFNVVRNGFGTSDPRVRYDRLTQRWFVIIINVSVPNRILLAVTDAASAGVISGGTVFTFFFIDISAGPPIGNANPCLADYPTLGVDNNALYIGANNFCGPNISSLSFHNTDGYVLRKSTFLGAGPGSYSVFRNLIDNSGGHAGPFTPQGVDNFDPAATEGYFIGVDNAVFGKLTMRRVSNPGTAPTISTNIGITTTSTSFPQTVPHLGNTGGANGNLSALDDRLFAAMIRNGRLWTAHNITVDTSGVAVASTDPAGRNGSRWYELQNLTGAPSVVQSGTVFDLAAANPRFYWIPSILISGQGHAAMGFSTAGANERANAATVGRLAGDALGTMQAPLLYTSSSTAYNPPSDPGGGGGRRWGDYSYVSLDPCDDMTMWTVQEFCDATNSYGVRVVRLIAPPPQMPDISTPSSVAAGQPSVNITINTFAPGFYDPGAGFNCRLSGAVSGGVVVNSATYNSPTSVTLNLNTTGVPAGPRNVTITNPDGQSRTRNNLLTVTAAPTPTPTPTPTQPSCATTVTDDPDLPGGLPFFAVTSGTNSVTVDHVNSGTGLQSLVVVGVPTNAIVNIPAFTPGTFTPVTVTYTVSNPNQFSAFTLRARNSSNGILIRVECGASGLQYYPLPNPIRLLDTRPGQPACVTPGIPLTGGGTRTEPARTACSGVPANAQAIVGNATVVNTEPGATSGFITLYPSGAAQPTVSNLNFVANQVVPNAFTVGLGSGDGAFNIFASSGTHFIVDITGYYAPPGTGGLFYHPLPNPVRLLDTRPGQPACDAPGVLLTGNGTRTEPARIACTGIPSSARVVVGNATVVNTEPGATSGFITLYPSGATQPTVSNLNFVANQVVPNAFTVGLGSGDGAFNIFASSGTHFIVDITGYYSDQATDVNGAGLFYNALPNPVRLLDTRPGQPACDAPGTPLTGGGIRTEPARIACTGVPTSARVVVGNATVVSTVGGSGFITLYPSGATQPTVSNLNFVAGQVVPNAFTVGLGSGDGAFNIFASSSTHFIADLTGYFAP